MHLNRRPFLSCLAAAVALAVSPSVFAQASNQLKVVVPFAPGGSADVTARLVGTKVAERLGKTLVVDNKSGAGGQIGLKQVISSPADGNTLLITPSGPISISTHLGKLPYDPAKDLTPVAMIAFVPTAIAVSAASSIMSLKDLIAEGKNNPRGISYAVAAVGTHMHLSGELLRSMTGAKLEAIPYRGTAPAVTAIVGGEVPAGVSDLSTLLPMAKGGRLRILAVTGEQRTSTAPDIPTVAELGVKGYAADAWIGMFAPAGTPVAMVNRLNAEVAEVLKQPDVRSALAAAGLEPMPMTPARLQSFLDADSKKWGQLIKSSNIKIEN